MENETVSDDSKQLISMNLVWFHFWNTGC